MPYLMTSSFLVLAGLVLLLILGPVVAGIFALVVFVVLLVVSLPVLVLLTPWIVIGAIIWFIS